MIRSGEQIGFKPARGILLLVVFVLSSYPVLGRSDRHEQLKQYQAANHYFESGKRLFERGDYRQARIHLQKCLETMPEHIFALYYQANIHYLDQEYMEALTCIMEAQKYFDSTRDLVRFGRENNLKSIEMFRDALSNDYATSNSCRESRRMEEAFILMEADEFTVTEQHEIDWQRLKSRYQSFYGNILYQLKRYAEAYRQYVEAVEMDPRNSQALNNIIAILYLSGRHGEAFHYVRVAEKNGLEEQLNLKLKHMLFESLQKPTRGILEEEFAPDPNNPVGVLRLAVNINETRPGTAVFYVNTYVVFHQLSRECVIVDPGSRDARIEAYISGNGLNVLAVLNTHGHSDHIQANEYYARLFKVPIFYHRKEIPLYPRGVRKDSRYQRLPEDSLHLNSLRFSLYHVPGHSAGSICFLISNFLISGDILFETTIGKLGGDSGRARFRNQKRMLKIIHQEVMSLPGDTIVMPGHGKTTTIADIKKKNIFINLEPGTAKKLNR